MKFPIWIMPALYGAAVGAIALAIVGFSWGGWMTGGGAQSLATKQSASAVALALMPYCLEHSQTDPQAATILASMKDAQSFNRRDMVIKAGWATPLGGDKPNTELAQGCQLKLAEAF